MATETLNHEMATSEDAKRPIVERLVIFFRSLFTRTYFYSGEVHIAPMQVKHIDGVSYKKYNDLLICGAGSLPRPLMFNTSN